MFHTDNIDEENRSAKTYPSNDSFQRFIIDVTELHLDTASFGNALPDVVSCLAVTPNQRPSRYFNVDAKSNSNISYRALRFTCRLGFLTRHGNFHFLNES